MTQYLPKRLADQKPKTNQTKANFCTTYQRRPRALSFCRSGLFVVLPFGRTCSPTFIQSLYTVSVQSHPPPQTPNSKRRTPNSIQKPRILPLWPGLWHQATNANPKEFTQQKEEEKRREEGRGKREGGRGKGKGQRRIYSPPSSTNLSLFLVTRPDFVVVGGGGARFSVSFSLPLPLPLPFPSSFFPFPISLENTLP